MDEQDWGDNSMDAVGEPIEQQVLTKEEMLERRRMLTKAAAALRDKEIELDFESNGPVAPKSTADDMLAAARRKAKGPQHQPEVVAAGRVSQSWTAPAVAGRGRRASHSWTEAEADTRLFLSST